MKTTTQKEIAAWLDLNEPFFSGILRGLKRPGAATADRLEQVSGISMRDWQLLPADQLKQKIYVAFYVNINNQEKTEVIN